jgi:cation diffusion facilitator CzcD-associated flavoprotein CzcO
LANFLRKVLPGSWAYGLTRWRNVLLQQYFYGLAKRRPEGFKERIVEMVQDELGPDFDVKKHFTPDYDPWDQRLCLVPDSDLFLALKSDKVSVVTDHIETFTANGIKLKSGKTLDADIIVTATGLSLQMIGGADIFTDGKKIEPGNSLNYKGVMLSNVPNLAITFGYTNASWTLKADLTSEYFCRLINHMDKHGYIRVMPRLDEMPADTMPFLDFSSGYIQRSIDQLPRQHPNKPWRLKQNYMSDLVNLRFGKVDDGVLEFQTADEQPETEQVVAIEGS